MKKFEKNLQKTKSGPTVTKSVAKAKEKSSVTTPVRKKCIGGIMKRKDSETKSKLTPKQKSKLEFQARKLFFDKNVKPRGVIICSVKQTNIVTQPKHELKLFTQDRPGLVSPEMIGQETGRAEITANGAGEYFRILTERRSSR